MFYIGEFSKMGKTTIKTLHHYDRIGLLHPEAVDGATATGCTRRASWPSCTASNRCGRRGCR